MNKMTGMLKFQSSKNIKMMVKMTEMLPMLRMHLLMKNLGLSFVSFIGKIIASVNIFKKEIR